MVNIVVFLKTISKKNILFGVLVLLASILMVYFGIFVETISMAVYAGIFLILREILTVLRDLGDETYLHNWSQSLPAKISIYNSTLVEMDSTQFICRPYSSPGLQNRKIQVIYMSAILSTTYLIIAHQLAFLDTTHLIFHIAMVGFFSLVLFRGVKNPINNDPEFYFKISVASDGYVYSIMERDTEKIVTLTEPPHTMTSNKEITPQPLLIRLFEFNTFFTSVPNIYLYLDLSDVKMDENVISEAKKISTDKEQILTYYNAIKIHNLLTYWSKSVSSSQ